MPGVSTARLRAIALAFGRGGSALALDRGALRLELAAERLGGLAAVAGSSIARPG